MLPLIPGTETRGTARCWATLLTWILFAHVTTGAARGEMVATAWRLDGTADQLESLLFRIDVATAQATLIGATGFENVTGLAADPTTGQLYGIQNDRAAFNSRLLAINGTTGVGVEIGATRVAISEANFDSSGRLYGWMNTGGFDRFNSLTDQLVRIDTATAEVSLIGESGTNSNQTGIAFHPDGTLYLKSGDLDSSKPEQDQRGFLSTLDAVTGAATFVTNLSGEPENVLEFDAQGTAYTIDRREDGSYLQTIDLVTGQLTEIARIENAATGQPLQVSSLASVTAVPEPSFLLLGSAGTLTILRRRRRAK